MFIQDRVICSHYLAGFYLFLSYWLSDCRVLLWVSPGWMPLYPPLHNWTGERKYYEKLMNWDMSCCLLVVFHKSCLQSSCKHNLVKVVRTKINRCFQQLLTTGSFRSKNHYCCWHNWNLSRLNKEGRKKRRLRDGLDLPSVMLSPYFLQCSADFFILRSPLDWFSIIDKYEIKHIFFSSLSWAINISEIVHILTEFFIFNICNI